MQLVITVCTIALAFGYILLRSRRALRSLRGGCSGGCGCGKTVPTAETQPQLIAPEQLVLRGRHK